MPTVTIQDVKRYAKRTAITLASIVLFLVAALVWAWNERADMTDTGLHPQVVDDTPETAVTATWLGVTTLLFDDGETQILIDGFFSRPSLADALLARRVHSDAATINYAMDEFRMRRLAAVIPSQSHFDHAMDIGAIANRSSASILGSESSANIARGAGVPEDQIIVAEHLAEYRFGDFTITMIEVPHAPIGRGGSVPVAGTIDQPLRPPATIWDYRENRSYSILVAHPHGTTLVHGSGGFVEGALVGFRADIVMLGVSLLEGLGRDYTERYWQATVTTTGARHVFPVHFDDFTQPFGVVEPYPRALDDFTRTARWLEEIGATWDADTHLHLPRFGKAIVLYPQTAPEA